MAVNRIWSKFAASGDAAPRGGGRRAGAAMPPAGGLRLPLPSREARAESLDDGSLQIVDTLPATQLGEFVGDLAAMVRDGVIETPASFALAVRDGMTVRFERGDVREGAAARMSAAIDGIGESICEGRVDPLSFAMTLECGCGLRVSRGDRLDDAGDAGGGPGGGAGGGERGGDAGGGGRGGQGSRDGDERGQRARSS